MAAAPPSGDSPGGAPGGGPGGEAGDGQRCGRCSHRISLVETYMKCRCGLAFCQRHRPPERHECTFDWRQMQQQKVARENPQCVAPTSAASSVAEWCRQHDKYHPCQAPGQRRAQQLHALGVLALCAFAARGVLLATLHMRFLLLVQQLVLGLALGAACGRLLPPALLGLPAPACRYCVFSWEVLQNAPWCAMADWEHLKEQLLYLLTAGKRNCLTRKLYDGPRTLPHIASTTAARLRELASGGAACCS